MLAEIYNDVHFVSTSNGGIPVYLWNQEVMLTDGYWRGHPDDFPEMAEWGHLYVRPGMRGYVLHDDGWGVLVQWDNGDCETMPYDMIQAYES